MTQHFYFDTSVLGGIFDEEFAELTAILFEKVKLGQIICVYSDLSENELSKAPKQVMISSTQFLINTSSVWK